jgi:large subunit ribosomal protein L13
MKCYQAKAGELTKHWYVIDATDQVVGRLAAQIAPILMGKHRPTYTPHIDTGDFVIVTNVDKVVFTGNKWQQKSYQRYTGHPGGQKEEQAWKLFRRRPERILELAVQRMMPKNKIGRHMLSKLKLYAGARHPHQAQAPIPLEALSGRPAPTGAVFAPKPEPKAPHVRAHRKPSEIDEPTTSPVPVASAEPITPPAPSAPDESAPPDTPIETLPPPAPAEPTTPPEATPGAE